MQPNYILLSVLQYTLFKKIQDTYGIQAIYGKWLIALAMRNIQGNSFICWLKRLVVIDCWLERLMTIEYLLKWLVVIAS